jgi:hypothetical protein
MNVPRVMNNKPLIWIVKLGIAAGILYYIFTFIPFTEVITTMSSVDGFYVSLAFVVLILERFVAAVRAKALSDRAGLDLSTYKIFEIGIVSTFYGMFAPGALGGAAARWFKMSQPTKKRVEALAVVGYERLVDTLGLIGIGFVFWYLDVSADPKPLLGIGLVGIFLLLVFLFIHVLGPRVVPVFLRQPAENDPQLVPAFVRSKIGKALGAVAQFHDVPVGGQIVIWTLTFARHLAETVIKYLFALSLGLDIPFVVIGWTQCLVSIVTMLPVSFSGLGVREGTMVVLLKPYGVAGSSAVALAFLFLILEITVATLGGLLEIKNSLRARQSSGTATAKPRPNQDAM